ncbi:hypothetical protein ACIQVA_36745 [Streptomyces microflavus]|uniref:hypothetical protein n=1 Tax=Streptomyces microflavus TaxID=1919 RepID=UPI0038017159
MGHGPEAQARRKATRPAGDTISAEAKRTRLAARVQDLTILAATEWLDHPDRERSFLRGYGRGLTSAERHALRCLTALDAANCLAWGPDNGDPEVTARGRRTLNRLLKEDRP